MKKKITLFPNSLIVVSLVIILLLTGTLDLVSTCFAQGSCWTQKTDMPTKRAGHSASVLDGKIYVFGGSNTRTGPAFNNLEVYDPQLDSWATKTNMPTARANLATCELGGKIYVLGGGQSFFWDPLETVEVYDPATDSWTTKTDMPRPRMGLTASVVDGKIYIIGGADAGENSYPEVDMYDPVTDNWTTKADFPLPRFNLASAVLDDKIYAIGGHVVGTDWEGYHTVDMYNPATDTWTTKAGMLTGRKYFTSCSLNGKIYVFGGSEGHAPLGPLSSVEEYDPETNTWTENTSIPEILVASSATTLDGNIYVIGGSNGSPFEDNIASSVYEYIPHNDLKKFVKNVDVDRDYATPGADDVLITAKTNNPTGITLFAKIEIPDQTPVDSVELFDDGNHNDGIAGDSLYANFWPAPPVVESNYYINLQVTRVDTDTVFHELNDMALFTTIGPLVFEDFYYITEDSSVNPGDIPKFKLILRNQGLVTTAEDVTAHVLCPDPRGKITFESNVNLGDIPAGESDGSAGFYILEVDTAGFAYPFDTLGLYISIASKGNVFWHDSNMFIAVGIESYHEGFIPGQFVLEQNYPNPFNPKTIIKYELPFTNHVNLSIYNLLGQKVMTLVNKEQNAGMYKVEWDAGEFASGVYYYRLQSDAGFVQPKKLILLK